MSTGKSLGGALALLALCSVSTATAAPGAGDQPKGEAAAKPPCPPGAVCEEATHQPPAELGEAAGGDAETAAADGAAPSAGGATTVVIPPPPPGTDPDAPRVLVVQPAKDGAPGQVVIYEAGAAPPRLPGVHEPVRPVPPPPPPPPKRKWRRHRKWGMNLRFDGVVLPRYQSWVEASGLIGLGLGLRFRPVPEFAIGMDTDFLGGSDSMGYERREIPLSLNATFYPNPRDPVQFYVFGGFQFAYAQVFARVPQRHLSDGTSDEYTYFGGQLGLGLEFRLSELVGINIDGYGFMRARLDDDSNGAYPELYDYHSDEGTNTTGGGVFRGGVTFWW